LTKSNPVVVDVEGLVGVAVDFVGALVVVAVGVAFEEGAADVVAFVDQNLMVQYNLNHFQKMEFVHKFQVFALAVVELPLLHFQLLIAEWYTVEQGTELAWIDQRVVQDSLVVQVLQQKG
jgi:hypothetical protein